MKYPIIFNCLRSHKISYYNFESNMFQTFEHFLTIYGRKEKLKYLNYKNENIETEYLKNSQKFFI